MAPGAAGATVWLCPAHPEKRRAARKRGVRKNFTPTVCGGPDPQCQPHLLTRDEHGSPGEGQNSGAKPWRRLSYTSGHNSRTKVPMTATPRPARRALLLLVGAVATWAGMAPAQAPVQAPAQALGTLAVIAPDNAFGWNFYQSAAGGDGHLGDLGAGGWGPNWAWRPFGISDRGHDGVVDTSADLVVDKNLGQVLHVHLRAMASGPRSLTYTYTVEADKDVPTTEFMASIASGSGAQDGNAVVTLADGSTKTFPLALVGPATTAAAAAVEFQSATAGTWKVAIDPPAPLHLDHGVRVLLAQTLFAAGTKTTTLTFTFPSPVTFVADEAGLSQFVRPLATPDWYPWHPSTDLGTSPLGFEKWLDQPAGKHGGVLVQGDHLAFADGTPVKFWGTNLAYAGSAPEKADADFMAARLAKWGVNAVRMHKFTGVGWAGIGDPSDATKMDPKGLDRLDYFANQLTKNGVYYGWSHTFNFEPREANRAQLLAYDEIKKNLNGNTYGLINYAPDVQDLLIASVVNLLQHPNPYTGHTYATDPALCYVELQNEDDIFFWSAGPALDKCPTYKKAVLAQWAAWLQAKYGTEAAWRQAWGTAAEAHSSFAGLNIALVTNPWELTSDHFPSTTGGDRQRLLDNAAFLHGLQDAFYGKFVAAIRATGYAGPIVGSPWQAPSQLPELLNLASDAKVGSVDRHNYFGGKLADTMMGNPGSGLLSTGLQQVAGHPFGVSEWITVYPSLYSAETPALMAAYGMGLQGWSSSYEFQSSAGHAAFGEEVGRLPFGVWNADTPTQLGQFPLLARMIVRGDVTTAKPIGVRRVSAHDLATGQFDFSDRAQQQGDVKTFTGTTPAQALAAGRCLIDFGPGGPSTFPDMSQFTQGTAITSSTGQLRWDTAGKGLVTINTAGTKGLVGFAQPVETVLSDVTLSCQSPYVSLLVTAADKGTTLANGHTALVSAMARSCNTGFTIFTLNGSTIKNGGAPVLMEPVKATLRFVRPIEKVVVLDQNGHETGQTLPLAGNGFTVDTAVDKTPYYEIVFAP